MASRFEWEKEIDKEDAEKLLKICEPGIIVKMRYIVLAGNHLFEVDEFYGENEGLVLAEVELNSEDKAFEKTCLAGRGSNRRRALLQFDAYEKSLPAVGK